MANNNHFSFPSTAYYTEGPMFSNNIFASTEDNLADASMSYNIDPVLQSPLPSDLYLEQWGVAQEQQLLVQRFLEDNQTKAFFNADVPSRLIPNRAAAAAAAHNMRPAVGIPPVPPPSHARFASPISSPGPSSSSDNMHSPPTDTDSHCEPFGSPAPLFQQPASFDPHWATTHEVQFVGMGPGDTCVNPHDINPSSQPMDCYENEGSNLDLSFPQRGYSFESYTSSTSQCDMEPANNTSSNTVAVLDLPVRRLSSPDAIEPVVKDEIRASTHFPPPPTSTLEAETETSDTRPLPPSLKRKKSGSLDDAYTPPNKKPNLNTRRQPRRGNAATTAQKPQPQQAPQSQSPPQKKTKTSHPTQSVPPAAASPPPPSSSTANMKALPPSSTSGRPAHACPDCTQSFKDQTLLENHIKKQHTRPFICVFHFAGCPSTFASKNEWKRHVASQHLLLNYWLCDEGSCGASSAAGNKPSTNGPPSAMHGGNGGTKARNGGGRLARNQNSGAAATLDLGDSAANHTNNGGGGVIFNRKDLYTQHVRRMHMPPQIKKSLKQQQQQQAAASSSSCTSTASSSSSSKKPSTSAPESSTATTTNPSAILLSTEWDTRLRGFQARAIRERCKLPLMMTCPAAHCDMVFHGEDSWDQRMEHVARHLEKAAQGREPPVRFGNSGGGEENSADDDDVDRCLVEWASRADVDIIRRKRKNKNGGNGWEWELNPLLKRGSAAQSCATAAAAAAGGSQGIVLLQSNTSAASGSGRRKNTRPAAAVRFAPVKDEEDEEEEVVIKNEIVVTSSDDDDEEEEEEKEIVVYEDDDGLRDAEGEEEDDE